MLRERDVDAAFVMSADLVSHFPATCAEYLKEIPMECDGTFYRLDDVPVYFQPFTKSPFGFTQSTDFRQVFMSHN